MRELTVWKSICKGKLTVHGNDIQNVLVVFNMFFILLYLATCTRWHCCCYSIWLIIATVMLFSPPDSFVVS